MKVIHFIPSLKIYGGAEKIVEKLCKENNNEAYQIYSEVDSLNLINKIKYIFFSIFFILGARNDYDIFHFHLFPSLYISIFAPKAKVIIHEHNTFNRRRKYRFLSYLERFIYRRSARVICISDATQESLINWCGGMNNTTVLSNFTRFEYVGDLNKRKTEHNCKKKLLMVASLTEQKKHSYLIETFKFLPNNYQLDLLGDGDKVDNLKAMVIDFNLGDRVNFHGNVDDLEPFYREADICLLLSNWEGFGLVVVEAASFNKVTICSNVSGLSDVVSNPELLVDNDQEPKSLASYIELIAKKIDENPNIYTEYCKNVTEKYSFSEYWSKLNTLYFSVGSN